MLLRVNNFKKFCEIYLKSLESDEILSILKDELFHKLFINFFQTLRKSSKNFEIKRIHKIKE